MTGYSGKEKVPSIIGKKICKYLTDEDVWTFIQSVMDKQKKNTNNILNTKFKEN